MSMEKLILKEVLDSYVEDGWLISQRHPVLPLTIYNYSQATQYEGYWDNVTLSCRGLVMTDDGEIVARPFKKFFNLEEGKHKPTPTFSVYEKVDGSLGILFWYQDQWILASRGSFTSDQAIKGWEILQRYPYENLDKACTWMFEILYPENRIVVNYGDREDMILLGGILTNTDIEVKLHGTKLEDAFNVVKKYDFDIESNSLEELKELGWDNSEGFVIRFSDGGKCKIKFEDYVRLHRIITNTSSYDIWDELRNNGKLSNDLLDNIPDEFYDWVKEMESKLWSKYNDLLDRHTKLYNWVMAKGFTNRKDLAIEVIGKAKKYDLNPGVIFSMIDELDYQKSIWKMIKPKYEKPFSI